MMTIDHTLTQRSPAGIHRYYAVGVDGHDAEVVLTCSNRADPNRAPWSVQIRTPAGCILSGVQVEAICHFLLPWVNLLGDKEQSGVTDGIRCTALCQSTDRPVFEWRTADQGGFLDLREDPINVKTWAPAQRQWVSQTATQGAAS